MRPGGVAEGESGSEVSSEVLDLLDVLEQLGIDALLRSLELLPPLLLLGLAALDSLQPVLGGTLELVLGEPPGALEEGVVDVGGDSVEGDAGGGGEDVCGIDPAQ